MSKRAGEDGAVALVKRPRQDEDEGRTQALAVSARKDDEKNALIRQVTRTSGLSAPIVKLEGAHSAEITSCRFDQTGNSIVAAGVDRTISLWRTYPPNTNYGLIQHAHKQAITSVLFSRLSPSAPLIYSASADGTLAVHSSKTGELVRRLRNGHTDIVNCLDRTRHGRELLVSGGDDSCVIVWDPEQRDPVEMIEWICPVTAVAWSDDGAQVFIGGLDNDIHAYDLRTHNTFYTLRGHTDTIAGLRLSPNGQYLLSTSYDSAVRVWDVRPFSASPTREHRVLLGCPAGFEGVYSQPAWSPDGARVVAGGADRAVTVWEVESGRVLYKLPGHTGTVTATDVHPKEPIIVSASKDATMFLGEIEPS